MEQEGFGVGSEIACEQARLGEFGEKLGRRSKVCLFAGLGRNHCSMFLAYAKISLSLKQVCGRIFKVCNSLIYDKCS